MTKLTDEKFENLFGTYKDKIVIETESKQEEVAEITQGSSNDLATLTINLVPQNELFDINNIPMLEYSALFRENVDPAINAYSKAILTDYNNRSIDQINVVDDIISNGYSAVESAVLWLEVINSNLNQLMGLVSVNNYLLGMSGLSILQDNYLLGMSGLPISHDTDLIVESYKSEEDMHREKYPENFALIMGLMGSGAGVGSLAGPPGMIAGAIVLPILYAILVTQDSEPIEEIYPENIDYNKFGSWDYKDPRDPNVGGSGTSSYLYSYTTPTFTGDKDDKINFPSGMPFSERERLIENYNRKPVTEKAKNDDLQSITTQELTGIAKAGLVGYSDKLSEMLHDSSFKSMTATQMITQSDSGASFDVAELPTEVSNTNNATNVLNSTYSNVESQPLVAMSGATVEDTFLEEVSELNKILTSIVDILSTEVQTAYGYGLSPQKATSMYSRNLLDNNTYENRKNTNAITSEDLYNNMYNERNYGEQKVEHIYNMPITNNTTVNVKNEPDYEKVTRHVITSMSNGLHSVAAARGRLMLD